MKVDLAFFQTGITMVGICTSETNSDKIPRKTEMRLTSFGGGGMLINAKLENGTPVQYWTPSANIKSARLVPEETSPKLKPVS